jgi:uncharacterized protein YcbX
VTLYSGQVKVILSGIYRYPVKSCRREELLHAEVEPWGLAGDRRWMIGRIVRDGSRLRPARPGRRLSRRQRPAAARAWPTGAGRDGTRRRAGLDRQLIPDSPAPGNMVRVGDPVEIVEAAESDGPPR